MLVTAACGTVHGLHSSLLLKIGSLSLVPANSTSAGSFVAGAGPCLSFPKITVLWLRQGPSRGRTPFKKDNKHPRLRQSHKGLMWVLSYYHRPTASEVFREEGNQAESGIRITRPSERKDGAWQDRLGRLGSRRLLCPGDRSAATPAPARQTAGSLLRAGRILFFRYYIHTQQMVTMVMMHFEQMFNFSQDKCSIALLLLLFPAQGCVCVREGEREREREEGKGEGGREGQGGGSQGERREREMLP